MTKVKQILKNLDERISSLQGELSHIRSVLPILLHELGAAEREERKRRHEHQGRFTIGQRVQWQENRHKTILTGTIIGIVPATKYPTNNGLKYGKKLATLRYRGYYRYEESYIVESSEGRQYWPRTNSLLPLDETTDE